jgi:hypothetical protein
MLVPQQSENLLGMPRKSIKNQNLNSTQSQRVVVENAVLLQVAVLWAEWRVV